MGERLPQRWRQRVLYQLQVDAQRRKDRADAVVQLARELFALGVLQLDQPARQRLELDAGVA